MCKKKALSVQTLTHTEEGVAGFPWLQGAGPRCGCAHVYNAHSLGTSSAPSPESSERKGLWVLAASGATNIAWSAAASSSLYCHPDGLLLYGVSLCLSSAKILVIYLDF